MRTIFILTLLLIFQHLFTTNAQADLTYKTYQGTGAYPSFPGNGGSLTYPTVLSTGTVTSLNYNWGSGYVLDSGRNERVIVNFYGYITIPDTGSQDIQFYLYADDGVYMKIANTVVINDWNEQGAGNWNYVSTDQTLTGGSTYYIDAWWYENGGGAAFKLYWDQTGSVALVPESVYATTYTPPSTTTSTGTSGGITSAQSTSKSSARTRANSYGSGDNTIYIDQAGNNNTIEILQDGTAGNHIKGLDGADASTITGNSNTLDIRQGADTSTGINLIEFSILGSTNDILLYQDRANNGYEDGLAGGQHTIKLDVDGNTNDIDIMQRNNYSTNGGHHIELEVTGDSNIIDLKQIADYSKNIFGKVTGNSNSVDVYQEGDSNKYLEFELIGNGHTLDVDQLGTGSHNASISLTNGSASSTVNLLQQGSTSQSYSLEQTCYTLGGCSATVTQGQ